MMKMKISETVVLVVVVLLFVALIIVPHKADNPIPTQMEGKHALGV